MGHNYESHSKAYPYAKAASVDSSFDEGIERLVAGAKAKKLLEGKACV